MTTNDPIQLESFLPSDLRGRLSLQDAQNIQFTGYVKRKQNGIVGGAGVGLLASYIHVKFLSSSPAWAAVPNRQKHALLLGLMVAGYQGYGRLWESRWIAKTFDERRKLFASAATSSALHTANH